MSVLEGRLSWRRASSAHLRGEKCEGYSVLWWSGRGLWDQSFLGLNKLYAAWASISFTYVGTCHLMKRCILKHGYLAIFVFL